MWFKVDDGLHSHPKAMAAGQMALGLWVVAGSWSADESTGGFIPDFMISRLSEDGVSSARKLVAAGLWNRVKGGYQFHEWDERNPDEKTAKAVKRHRSDAAVKANHERWHASKGITSPSCVHCSDY